MEYKLAGTRRDIQRQIGMITHVVSPRSLDLVPIGEGTDAATRETVYFAGTSTNLKTGDALLFVAGEGNSEQIVRVISSVNAQADAKRTEVVLQEQPPATASVIVSILQAGFQPFIDEAGTIFSDVSAAAEISTALEDVLDGTSDSTTATEALNLVSPLVPIVQEKHDVAEKRGFSRLEPWMSRLLSILNDVVNVLSARTRGDDNEPPPPPPQVSMVPGALSRLTGIVDKLIVAPSLQPANSQRLVRTLQRSFAAESDVAPRLLATFYPRAKAALYKAWAGTAAPGTEVTVNALRVKASLFASSYAGVIKLTQMKVDDKTTTSTPSIDSPLKLTTAWPDLFVSGGDAPPTGLPLDAVYDQIKVGSWIAVDRRVDENTRKTTYHQVGAVQTQNMDTHTGFTAKCSVLTLQPPWLSDSNQLDRDLGEPKLLRTAVVYAQAEPLDLAEEPLDVDVHGNSIELDGLYNDLEPGRWIIVSGERTDILDTTGVTASELVMISAVTQGAGKASCLPFNTNTVPFSGVFAVTEANGDGDRLILGIPDAGLRGLLNAMPDARSSRQQICDVLQVAPGLWVNAYVPTAAEKVGDFSSFASLIPPNLVTDPPISGGVIPKEQIDFIFGWRFKNAASPADTVHTTLELANSLSYTYNAADVSVYGNVAKATHGQTIGEVLGDGDASQPFETFALRQKPLTYTSAATPAGAESTLLVRVNEIEWNEADNLAGLIPTDRSYAMQTNDDDQTSVVFGNGEHGARIPTGTANIKATYRYGIGASGNVGAAAINQLATHPPGLQGVVNPLAASGGADRDTIDQARRNAPLAVAALDRLVSVDDYANFARTYAGIGKAAAARLSDGRRQLVHLTIAGVNDIPIDQNADLYRNLIQSLLLFGDPQQALQVCLRKVQLLVIIAGVQINPDFQWEIVEANMRAALVDHFSFDNRDLGQSAFLSEAIAIMQKIEGVMYVDVQNFGSISQDATATELASLATRIGRAPHVQAQLAKPNPVADATVSDPCRRILPAEVVYLTPDIPATLILNPIAAKKG